jgi:hypothetical protein
VCICLSIIHLPYCLFVCLYICSSICQSLCLPITPSMCYSLSFPSIDASVKFYVCLTVLSFTCLSVFHPYNVSVHLSISLSLWSFCLSVPLSVCSFTQLYAHQSNHLPLCLSACLPISLFYLSPSFCLPTCPYVFTSVCPSFFLSVHLSIRRSICKASQPYLLALI